MDLIGLSAISLPDISERLEVDLLYQAYQGLETHFLSISETVCVLLALLSLAFFAGGNQILDYPSPIVGLQVQCSWDTQLRWFSSFEYIVFEKQAFFTVGLSF